MANKNKPVMITRAQNHVGFSWKDAEVLRDGICVLQMLDEMKRWTPVYWGPKKELKIAGLAPCTCYDFRIKSENAQDWVRFRGATLDGPYLAMHMTRAIKFGKTPLIRKIAHARPLLLEVENKDMKTPLVQAIDKNDPALVNLLITLGANVNSTAHYTRRTPLMAAVALGHLSVASLLIDKGCSVNATDINGLNVLHYAVDSNNLDSVEFVLKQGLHVDAQDSSGWTPLMRAAILSCGEEIVNVLLQNGASKSVEDKNGFNFDKHQQLARL